MMPVEIDPSEVRRPRGDPSAGLRARLSARLGRPAMLAALGLVGVGGFAGLAAAAYPAISDMLRPRPPQVHFGRVADMPEIKDGVPALRTTPVRQVPLPQAPGNPTPVLQAAATSEAVPPLTPPVASAALLDPKPNALTQGAPARGFSSQGTAQGSSAQGGAVQGKPAQNSGSPSADVAATGTAAALQPVPAIPKARETPRPVAAPRDAVTPRVAPRTVAREPVPLPPSREKVAEPKATPRPAPVREAKADARPESKPVPGRHAAEKPVAEKRQAEKPVAEKPVARREKPEAHQRSAAVQAAPAPEEPTRFLGVPMPDLAPAGRAIRETVDAVISLPSRL